MNSFNSISVFLFKKALCNNQSLYQEKIVKHNQSKPCNTLTVAADFIYHFNKLDIPYVSLFHELFHKYCQQTIFISNITPTSQIYRNRLIKTDTISVKEKRKQWLRSFNQSVVDYLIIVNTLCNSSIYNKSTTFSIQYIWKKYLNIYIYKLMTDFLCTKRSVSCSKFSVTFFKQLEASNLPLFVVINNLKQIVITEPPEAIVMRNQFKSIIYRWYYHVYLSGQDQAGIYDGWFFINPEDAKEYKYYIANKYKRSYQQNGLNLFISGIHLYYRLNRISPARIHFRLFPDLMEVGNLVTNYSYRRNVEFDRKQNCGKNYFQGQPIYFIKPVIYHVDKYNKKYIINYYHEISTSSSLKKYYPIFLNRQVALDNWKRFRQTMKQKKYRLPKKPMLHVYNLEDFLKDNENCNHLVNHDFLLVPSKDTYSLIKSIKQHSKITWLMDVNKYISPSMFWCKLWSQRILGSLVSRQPQDW